MKPVDGELTTPVDGELGFRRGSPEERNERILDVLRTGDVTPVFQPIMELETGRVLSFEALSRFPGDQAYSPDRWFADAWSVGLGMDLELLAVRKIIEALPELPPKVGLSLNASPEVVGTNAFIHELGPDPTRITVELTEHVEIEDPRRLRKSLAQISKAGGKTAIDDFGAGYSNLQHIIGMEPDWIKLDISLTERIDENSTAHALAETLVTFAAQIDAGVIAEGIETVESQDALEEIGISVGQGFQLGMPEPLNKALAVVE